MIKNFLAFVGSLLFSIGAVILIKALIKAFNIPTFAIVTITFFSSYSLILLSVLYDLTIQPKKANKRTK